MKPNLIEAVAQATSHRDRDDLDRSVARMLYEHVQPDRLRIYRVLGEEGRLRAQLRVIMDRDGLHDGGAPTDPALLPLVNEKPHWHECALLQDAVHYLPEGSIGERFDTVFPVLNNNGLAGLIEVEFSGARAAIRPHDANLVQGILRILRNHLSALDYGERDTLTGLLNRRTFESTFAKLRAAPGSAADHPSAPGKWIGVIDVDRFKSINDNYGHLFGDEVLLLVARLMFENFRSTEMIYRFGGEEFVVVLDNTNEEGASIAFERFRAAVESYRFPQVGQVTISIGYTGIQSSDVPASAMERSDRALYYSKEHGRNQALCFERLVREGKLSDLAKSAEVELF